MPCHAIARQLSGKLACIYCYHRSYCITKEVWDITSQKAQPCYRELEVRRLFSLMSADGKQSICLFEASSADALRSVYRKVGLPFKQVWRSQLIAHQSRS
ncbi:MAG TPA: nickel-binding protein [Chroococcales cyanobacterium]